MMKMEKYENFGDNEFLARAFNEGKLMERSFQVLIYLMNNFFASVLKRFDDSCEGFM